MKVEQIEWRNEFRQYISCENDNVVDDQMDVSLPCL